MNNYREIFIKKRKHMGISQIKLSKMVGITQTFMSEIESGRKTPSLETFFSLCDVLDIKLFPDEEIMFSEDQ